MDKYQFSAIVVLLLTCLSAYIYNQESDTTKPAILMCGNQVLEANVKPISSTATTFVIVDDYGEIHISVNKCNVRFINDVNLPRVKSVKRDNGSDRVWAYTKYQNGIYF